MEDWEGCKTSSEESEGISWVLRIISSDTFAIVKDTEKEDKEKALKQAWEQNEPGRGDKAKKSRTKYIV